MNKSVLHWRSYEFEASLSDEGNRDWLDLKITNQETLQVAFARLTHLIEAKVWQRELLRFKRGDTDFVEIFKLGSDFAIRLERNEGRVVCRVDLNPDPLLENHSESIEFKDSDVESIGKFIDCFVREYKALVG